MASHSSNTSPLTTEPGGTGPQLAGPCPTATIGVDIGGTFTDLCCWDGREIRTFKLPSSPPAYQRAVIEGVRMLGSPRRFDCVQGSTIATNALLERKGRRTALVTTAGFADLLLIGRQNRPTLYDLDFLRPDPVVRRDDCFGVPERVDPSGAVIQPLDENAAGDLLDRIARRGIKDLAVCLLFGFLNPDHERRIAALAGQRGLRVSLASEITPEFREYERAATTAINAYVAPLVADYVQSLHRGLRELGLRQLLVMQSNGGQISWKAACRQAVRTILSGPAGGVVAAQAIARQTGLDRIITYDMGGTSTDVALCRPRPEVTTESMVDGQPIRTPMLAIHTVGAGGGSIARIDAGGALKVGPDSAGADPGPACYGRGRLPTVTDANLILGRIDPRWFLGGRMVLDAGRARRAIADLAEPMGCTVEQAAEGIVRVANANMARAIKAVSAQRGYDPAEYWLTSFGGAGGLHACELAGALEMAGVLVPANPGILSAMGMLLADWSRDFSRSIPPVVYRPGRSADSPGPCFRDLDRAEDLPPKDEDLHRLHQGFADLMELAADAVQRDGYEQDDSILERAADMRYLGQSHELTVPVPFVGSLAEITKPFHDLHRRRFGHHRPHAPVEIVTLRLTARVVTDKPLVPAPAVGAEDAEHARVAATRLPAERFIEAGIYHRSKLLANNRLTGPALVVEDYATTYVPAGWRMSVDHLGNLRLVRSPAR